MRAREAALERMRKGRSEIEQYHAKIYQERSQSLAKVTRHSPRAPHMVEQGFRHKNGIRMRSMEGGLKGGRE